MHSLIRLGLAIREETRMNIRCHVELSEAERCELTALVGSGKHYARKIKRAPLRTPPRRAWQGTLARRGSRFPRTPSAMDVPFHPDIGLLAQRRRGLLRNPHKAKAQAHSRLGTDRCLLASAANRQDRWAWARAGGDRQPGGRRDRARRRGDGDRPPRQERRRGARRNRARANHSIPLRRPRSTSEPSCTLGAATRSEERSMLAVHCD